TTLLESNLARTILKTFLKTFYTSDRRTCLTFVVCSPWITFGLHFHSDRRSVPVTLALSPPDFSDLASGVTKA
ncbi:hypothetical protein RRG08_001534, partial [Elysia crispata]